MALYKLVSLEPCDCCNAQHEVAMLPDIQACLSERGLVAVPKGATLHPIQDIGDIISETENRLGMGHGGWDMVNAEELVSTIINVASFLEAAQEKGDE